MGDFRKNKIISLTMYMELSRSSQTIEGTSMHSYESIFVDSIEFSSGQNTMMNILKLRHTLLINTGQIPTYVTKKHPNHCSTVVMIQKPGLLIPFFVYPGL